MSLLFVLLPKRYLLTLRSVVLITLYCPYIANAPSDLPLENKETWQADIRNKMDSAALRSNAVVDNIVREKLLPFSSPMT